MNDIEKAIEKYKELIEDNKDCVSVNELRRWRIVIKALEKQLSSSWISVSERFPTKEEFNKDDGRFIVTDGNRVYQSMFDIYDNKRFIDIVYSGNCNFEQIIENKVIAWQLLPERYKEDEKK